AGGHPLQRVEELRQVGDPVLEQVADPLRAVGQQLGGVPLLHVLGQDDHDVGPVGVDLAQELLGVSGGRLHLIAGLGEQPGQALSQQHRVLGHHYPHGSTAAITVGPPSGLVTKRRPSIPATRAASPDRPWPVRLAPPTPSSLMATLSRPPDRVTVTSARLALACLATLVRASATTK